MAKHRAERPPRPRVGRIIAAGLSFAITGTALLGGIGWLPLGGADPAADPGATPAAAAAPGAGSGSATDVDSTSPRTTTTSRAPSTTPTAKAPGTAKSPASNARTTSTALPDGSGSGRRVVFSMTDQRVWLVDAKDRPVSTYLVSGSVTDNLKPGTYHVYSRSRWAVGIDDSGVMQYFVRFTRGNNAAIGFHSIPTKNGKPLQSESQLGTPQSHGCIRQRLEDAERMWGFAQDGTEVVVLA
jgi:hypothetical protein